jgi:hypothetical protein
MQESFENKCYGLIVFPNSLCEQHFPLHGIPFEKCIRDFIDLFRRHDILFLFSHMLCSGGVVMKNDLREFMLRVDETKKTSLAE